MKGLILYYSGSGNTKLACQYIASTLKNVDFDLIDIAEDNSIDFNAYKIIGFATFADFWGPPQLMKDFINKLVPQNKLAFVFNTYGLVSGRTIRVLKNWVQEKGFNVIAGHSLHTPQNFPQMVANGLTFKNAPGKNKKKSFDQFLKKFDKLIHDYSTGKKIKKIKLSFSSLLMPVWSRLTAQKVMGQKYLDENLCTTCGTCQKKCPYKAIRMLPKPEFDQEYCYGCWACFHHCPTKAIYTKEFKNKGHYKEPGRLLREKLRID